MILIVDTNDDVVLAMRRLLFANGMLSTSCAYRTAIGYQRDREIDAVLLTSPYAPTKPPRFCYSYRPKHPDIPIIMVRQPLRPNTKDMEEADALLDGNLPPHKFFRSLLVTLSSLTGRDYADCIAGCARDHLLMPTPMWNGTPIPLTPTERAIYRYLICTHPTPATAKELLRRCTKPGTSPTLCNIPSHVYRINLKAQRLVGHHVIDCPDNFGYRLTSDG